MVLRVIRNIHVNGIIGWIVFAGDSDPITIQASAQGTFIYAGARISYSLPRRIKV
jgi:hypothetical protein